MDENHLPYFKLLESLKNTSCPVCRLLEVQIAKYQESILYEEVNNVFFRSKLRTDQGFCNRHAHQLLEYKDALGVAIIHRELFQNALDSLKHGPRLIPLKKGVKTRCLVCQLEAESESRYLATIIDSLTKPDFQEAFQKSEGLCFPHYEKLQKRKKRLPAWFKEHQNRKLRDLLAGLDRFIASYNVSLGDRQPKLTENEKTVWREAVARLHGYRGLP